MRKLYHTNLFYRYIIVFPDNTSKEVTETTFYEYLYTHEIEKNRKYADCESILMKDKTRCLRFRAYLDVEDTVEIEPFIYPEEVKPVIPKTKENIENSIYWHNIKNFLGKKWSN